MGAAGTNAVNSGWSVEMQAGASSSTKIRRASRPPTPFSVIVVPTRSRSSAAGFGPSSVGSSRIRSVA